MVIFNKDNKDFQTLLKSIDDTIKKLDRCTEIVRVSQNEWQGKFTKEAGSYDMLKINISVYDLYIKE